MGDVTPIKLKDGDGNTPRVCCGTCAYAVSRQVLDEHGKPIIGQYQLECRESPPQIVLAMVTTPQGTVPIFPPSVTFPPVTPEIWCHRYGEGEPQPHDGEPILYGE